MAAPRRAPARRSRSLGKTGDAFLMTKVWTSGREAGIRQMRDSLGCFGVERIALMQIHNLVDWRTHLATLSEWKAAGTFRYIGITHYTAGAFAEVEAVLRRGDGRFPPDSLFDRRARGRSAAAAAVPREAVWP